MNGHASLGARRLSRAFAVSALTLAIAHAASARTELLRWQHGDASTVAGFKVYVGNATGAYQTTLDVGKPTPSSGVYSYSLQVPDSNTVYVAVSAYGSTGLESTKSNEQRRLGLLGTPGKPQITP
jgi:hypothetical protein